ncbi:MAG TPA: 3-octaprenyl-4-hydroxybenzoate carboxy-lyase, partial [Geobacteraceae bacterium]|nr:3-octaprenyl-4-hydroxybenzoate carboxy-lyase [Geobacteraceae bacterium]
LSLAKFLWIFAREDNPSLDVHDIPAFFQHMLERVDWRRDLHFQTRTTIDTLDYSGEGLNRGSKVVIAAAGPKIRVLANELPPGLRLPEGFSEPRIALPGVLAVKGPRCSNRPGCEDPLMMDFCDFYPKGDQFAGLPLIIVVDDSEFTARTLNNFLWVVFTRSNPATDIYGIGASFLCKHWGCEGPLVIDARIKPHHAPPLIDDPLVEKKVDALGAPGGPLHGII